ncbi:hypothetical protein CDD83_642 [Cordyceps sp. RAO-2017]|nr:hypothetical protein CDD83_642 [Cordyceps sp. RAO-2017]
MEVGQKGSNSEAKSNAARNKSTKECTTPYDRPESVTPSIGKESRLSISKLEGKKASTEKPQILMSRAARRLHVTMARSAGRLPLRLHVRVHGLCPRKTPVEKPSVGMQCSRLVALAAGPAALETRLGYGSIGDGAAEEALRGLAETAARRQPQPRTRRLWHPK